MSVVAVQDISKQFGTQVVLEDVSFELNAGETVGLVGANGVGKTTLFRLIAGEMSPDTGTVTRAKGLGIGFLRQEPDIALDRTLHDEVGRVFAPLLALERELHDVSEQMADHAADQAKLTELMNRYERINARFIASGGHTFDTKLNEILGGLGFSPADYAKPMSILSGGEKCRAALAKLLLLEHRLLLLDEPTNHLDIDAVRWLEKFLAAHHGTAVIVSHDRYLLDRLCDRIIELDRRRVASFPGNYSNYAQTRAIRLLTQQRQFEKDAEFVAKEQAFIAKHLATQRTREAQGRRKRLERRLKAGEFVTETPQTRRSAKIRFEEGGGRETGFSHRRSRGGARRDSRTSNEDPRASPEDPRGLTEDSRTGARDSHTGTDDSRTDAESPGTQRSSHGSGFRRRGSGPPETVLRCDDLCMAYDAKALFADLTLQVPAGLRQGITGPNGTGKTTLLKIILGEVASTGGMFALDRRLRVGYYAQEEGDWDPDHTIVDETRSGCPGLSEQDARTFLARFLFTGDDVFKTLGVLSGGERSRVRLAALILQQPEILILDEPTNHLDIPSREALEAALDEFSGTIIVVSHDRYFLDRVVDRLLVMRSTGYAVCDGNYSYYIEQVERQRAEARSQSSSSGKRPGRSASIGVRAKSQPSPYDRLSVEELEALVIEHEEKLAAIYLRFADADVYKDPDRLVELREQMEAIEHKLAEVDAAWQERVDAESP